MVPNPIKSTNEDGTVTIEAKLLAISPTTYAFSFRGFEEGEILEIATITGNEEAIRQLSTKGAFMLAQGEGCRKGGIAKAKFERGSGKVIKLNLPLGMELLRNIQ
jgi:hypothetical protein